MVQCNIVCNISFDVILYIFKSATIEITKYLLQQPCNKMNMFIVLHGSCNMLYGGATPCNIHVKRVQHFTQHFTQQCCTRLTSAVDGYFPIIRSVGPTLSIDLTMKSLVNSNFFSLTVSSKNKFKVSATLSSPVFTPLSEKERFHSLPELTIASDIKLAIIYLSFLFV